MPDELIEKLEWILNCRRSGRREFGPGIFSDPAWDILIELFLAALEDRVVPIQRLGHITYDSVLVRWLAILEDRGLIARDGEGPHLLRLTDFATLKMRSIFGTETPAD